MDNFALFLTFFKFIAIKPTLLHIYIIENNRQGQPEAIETGQY
jgi:hypothetical protein